MMLQRMRTMPMARCRRTLAKGIVIIVSLYASFEIGRHSIRREKYDSELHSDLPGSTSGRFQAVTKLASYSPSKAFDPVNHNHSCDIQRPQDGDVRYRNDHWQIQEEMDTGEEIVAYSAFYDDRPLTILNGKAQIRILGIRRIVKEPERTLFCYVWCPGNKYPFVTTATVHVTGRNYFFKPINQTYGQRMFSCAVHSIVADILSASLDEGKSASSKVGKDSPVYVSLSTRMCPDALSILLPVLRPVMKNSAPLHEFGVCVAIAFGHLLSREELVEWFEANILFGVTEFNVYDGLLHPSVKPVLAYYSTRRRLLNLHQMPPGVDDLTDHGIRLSSPASLNDCMMRNMYRYRYMVVIDFDELIVPRQHSNYSQLVFHLNQNSSSPKSHHTYTFRMAYFFMNFSQDTSQPKLLKTMRFRYRTEPGAPMFAPKSFVDPRRCLSVFNHYCWIKFPLESGSSFTANVDPANAIVHHYRWKCPFDQAKCKEHETNQQRDDTMLRFKKLLEKKVSDVLEEMNR